METKIKITNKNLIEWYNKGFKDEITGSSTVESDNNLLNHAYSVGAKRALGEAKYLTQKEILTLIKESK